MGKYEAVDRMMAMATAKRADPEPPPIASAAAAVPPALEGEVLPRAVDQDPGHSHAADQPAAAAYAPSATDRARAVLDAARPFLPVVAGAIRQAESGPLKAVARLLPMLGGVLSAQGAIQSAFHRAASSQAPSAPPLPASETAQREFTKQLAALQLRQEASEDESRRLRTQLERLSAEHTATAGELRAVVDRLRLVTAAAIVLLMLLVAQLIVTVVVTHR